MSADLSQVSARSRCTICDKPGRKTVFYRDGRMWHYVPAPGAQSKRRHLAVADPLVPPRYLPCLNYDDECRHIAESLGFYVFAWLPVRARNGKMRWLRWVERHEDGTVTLGNRAH
jgi:hypothetical protein